jgi:hypothetical protein
MAIEGSEPGLAFFGWRVQGDLSSRGSDGYRGIGTGLAFLGWRVKGIFPREARVASMTDWNRARLFLTAGQGDLLGPREKESEPPPPPPLPRGGGGGG